MTTHLHDYRAPVTDGIVDGAILMHREMARAMVARQNVALHDLTQGPDCLRAVRDGDVVYAGSGPFAHLYHLWRERSGVDFRIVREVHTALWSGYWLQDELCAPLVRPGDLALFPTEYTRQLFAHNFPSVRPDTSAVVYPFLDRLGSHAPVPTPAPGSTLRIGYLGALSEAKNFDQVLDVFGRVHRETGGAATLLYAGKPNDPKWTEENIRDRVAAFGVPASAIASAGILRQDELPAFFGAVDVLLFPSTASRETLGRVVLEALSFGVPVLAADVGPAVELLPERNLVPTRLSTGTELTMSKVGPLGQVDEAVLVAKLVERDYDRAGVLDREPYLGSTFWRALSGATAVTERRHDGLLPRAVRVPARPEAALAALEVAERVHLAFFTGQDGVLHGLLDEAGHERGEDLSKLRSIVDSPRRNLADYRALPKLLDAVVLPPLPYSLVNAEDLLTAGRT
ncbi:glycosyltransferase involved in cell wall biosynthesis [Crossiella equi]|uniref:Glycosyltransferase involved in cell wall biosynthesis n=1 Tax=Crossiella equi TaxID=130796 RepID=A0ABS5AQY2_9PSEU|nr:glycosyltransferase [Crossiella equi]MBP2478629.1 glycosyltransferase involved in cell wall biosynthesis [Crossiella equi]